MPVIIRSVLPLHLISVPIICYFIFLYSSYHEIVTCSMDCTNVVSIHIMSIIQQDNISLTCSYIMTKLHLGKVICINNANSYAPH